MKLAVGMITAPRQSPTATGSVTSLINAFQPERKIVLFAEPKSFSSASDIPPQVLLVNRPYSVSPNSMPVSPDGVMGNFGNWIQSARDLLALYQDCDTFLMCEDDILVSHGLTNFFADRLWPSPHCGCLSLYSPSLSHYHAGRGLVRTNVMYTDILSTHHNLVGALCLLFPRNVLQELVSNQAAIDEWRGSHKQRRDPNVKPWERKAIDTWIGRTLVQMGYEIWNFNPSLVKHVGFTSSLGNGTSIHNRSRASNWAGENVSLTKTYGSSPIKKYDEVRPKGTPCGHTSGSRANTGNTTAAVIASQ